MLGELHFLICLTYEDNFNSPACKSSRASLAPPESIFQDRCCAPLEVVDLWRSSPFLFNNLFRLCDRRKSIGLK